jgi:Lon protease-like protein
MAPEKEFPMRRPSAMAISLVLAFGVCSFATSASAGDATKPASIAFANLGAIQSFRAIGDDALLIEASGHRWFRATFFGPCLGLRSAEKLAFVTEPGGSLDRFSAVWVDGQRCPFRSFEATEPPARKPRKH